MYTCFMLLIFRMYTEHMYLNMRKLSFQIVFFFWVKHRGLSRPFCLLKIWPLLYYNHTKGGINRQNFTNHKFSVASFFLSYGDTSPSTYQWIDHSFYWYVQTTNIGMFSAFINEFSNRLQVCQPPLSTWPPVAISLVLDFHCRIVVCCL